MTKKIFLAILAVITGISVISGLIVKHSNNSACNGICAGCNGCNKTKKITSNYYIDKKDDLLKQFDKNQRFFKKVLAETYQENEISVIFEETRREFEKIIPYIPYIGGDNNLSTEDIENAAMALAFYRIQKKYSKTTSEIGAMIYRATEIGIYRYPKWLLGLIGRKTFNKKTIELAKKNAEQSQKRCYKGDWVTVFVPGDGANFDWGCDHQECGILKFFSQQGAVDLVPYMCKLDYLYSEAFGQGLIRTGTLAEGGKVCDFRFKKGRKTEKPGVFNVSN